jgi:hypothetical protein
MNNRTEWENYRLTPLSQQRDNTLYELEICTNGKRKKMIVQIKLPYSFTLFLEDGKIDSVIDNSSIGMPPGSERELYLDKGAIQIKTKDNHFKGIIESELENIIHEKYDSLYAWKT